MKQQKPTSLVKKLVNPKTDKAREFIAEHGDTFTIVWIDNDYLKIRSMKTRDVMIVNVINGHPHINGELVEWE